jgi:hypothetical protein
MVATDTTENGCKRVTTASEIDPELARLIEAWPMLPKHVRQTMLGLVDSFGILSQLSEQRSGRNT